MAVPNTRQRAKELVQQIAKNHGYLGEEKLRSIEPELRREIEEAFLKKDEMIGSSVITLAKNLYTSKARFVFELLQNADDNKYSKAAALGAAPCVSFRVFPRRIVMECNEDGFTDENLEAICSVGKSSKTGSQGYIGEKGIGFKSVFMAAWKAHIQSGEFSFSFSHRNGESGMGMISPIWEDAQEDRGLSLTRLILHLHETGDSSALEKTHQIIQEQFKELQETILLFMKNLRVVQVAFHGTNEEETSSVKYSIERPEANRAVLTRTHLGDGTKQQHVKHYHVTVHQATGIPRHENRTISGQDDHTSQVVLAFPLSETSVPIIEPQDIFVYLPVRAVGFNFIIQADFVTDASRQDIVKDSLRNGALLDGVADAFARAVLQFCEHDGLRLQWMRYLPDRNDKNWSGLWRSLVDKIAERFLNTRVLYCHKRFDRHRIRDLVRLASDNVSADGEPLFEDGDPEEIVSQHYNRADLEILMDYGLKIADFGRIRKWLTRDLARGAQSRMRSATTADSWHTQAAILLHLPFSQKWPNDIAELKKMNLLPLQGGVWVSVTTGPVFFGTVDGIDIPPNIGLRIIDESITNTHRRTLFKDLGVQKAPISLVRRKILELYGQPGALHDLSLQTSKQHLTFLYLTHHLEPCDDYSKIFLFDQDENIREPSEIDVYMATDRSPYSPWELLKGGGPTSGPGSDAPGFMAYFMNEEYFLDPPQTPPTQELTWAQWFHEHLEVKDHVLFRLQAWPEVASYLQKHRPDRFVGALRLHNNYLGTYGCPFTSEFIARLQETEVLCRGSRKVPLKNSHIPTKSLEALVNRFMEQETFFPWLWVDPEIPKDTALASWDPFLNACSGGLLPRDDLQFALDMLQYSMRALHGDCTPESEDKLCSLYIYIQSQYLAVGRGHKATTRIRDVFTDTAAIYVPLADSNTWASPQDCVWDAVQELSTKFVLEIHYKRWLSKGPDHRKDLESFFCDTLGVSGCTLEIYVDELKSLRDSGSENSDAITAVYKALDNLCHSSITQEIDQNWLKGQFEEHALIHAVSNECLSWRKTSQCVWSVAARLRDKVSLNSEYEDLRVLFVDVLGVKKVTLKMAIEELREAGGRQSISVEEVKASIQTVNSLLCSKSDEEQPKFIEESRVLPVRYPGGGVQCVTTQTKFFIVDRESLQSQFEDRVKFLDFSLEEVNELRHFLKWARLEDRYVTRCVRESTSVQASDALPIPGHGREISQRAHALLRIAWHFKSPRVAKVESSNALYELLRNAKILATDTISLELSLSQDSVAHKALGGSMNVHLHEENSNLTVYLPHSKDLQEHAFKKHLPERLLQWLMTDEASQIRHETSHEAVMKIKDVWNTPLATLSKTLDECGIGTISTPDIDAPSEQIPSHRSSGDGGDSEITDNPAPAPDILRHDSSGTYSRGNSSQSFTPDGTESESEALPVRPALRSRPASPLEEVLVRESHYVSLLGRIIASARTGTIPDRNENQPIIAYRASSNIYGSNQFERDCKVGAAGELFVFELLSHLDPALPNFSRANWQSNMRRYVTVHPDYATMDPWAGRETSDITYTDTNGVLTSLMIRNHYLDADRWAGTSPRYFIEVKTTTLSCDAPFYMSNGQYQRMKNTTLSRGSTDAIYVIFRVYHLDQGDQGPGLRAYVDPESLRVSGELEFSAPTWTVVPGENAAQAVE